MGLNFAYIAYVSYYLVSKGKVVLQVGALFLWLAKIVLRYMGFSWVWVGLDIGSTSSPGSGIGWVGSVIRCM